MCDTGSTDHTDPGSRCGIWFRPNDPRNIAFRVPQNKQSNQIGELAAIIIIIQKVHHFCPLEIISDLRYAIEKHLKTKRVIN